MCAMYTTHHFAVSLRPPGNFWVFTLNLDMHSFVSLNDYITCITTVVSSTRVFGISPYEWEFLPRQVLQGILSLLQHGQKSQSKSGSKGPNSDPPPSRLLWTSNQQEDWWQQDCCAQCHFKIPKRWVVFWPEEKWSSKKNNPTWRPCDAQENCC